MIESPFSAAVAFSWDEMEVLSGDARVPVTAASITKAMFAATVIILSDLGELNLFQPLGELLHERVDWLGNVTWLDTLAHMAGFPFELNSDWWHEENSATDEELHDELGQVELLKPGQWHYSNAGYQVLALALKAATGEAWARLAEAVLWAPAGMTSTRVPSDKSGHAGARLAAGGVITTLEDLCRFGAILGGRNPELLSEDSLSVLSAPRAVAGPGLLQAAGVQLILGARTQLLAWGTLRDTTVGLIVDPGMHAVAVSRGKFAAGSEVKTRLLKTSEVIRNKVVSKDMGVWWLDGVGVEVVIAGDTVVARDPNSPVALCSAPLSEVSIGTNRIDLERYVLWRDVVASAW